MEYQKIINLLGNIPDKVPSFITKKWIKDFDQSGGTYSTNKQIRFKTPIIRSDLHDYNDAYIVVTGKITVTDPDNNGYDKKLALKNNALFISCISKINGTLVDNAEDLDVAMPLYNLLGYSKNYRKTTEILSNYYRDEPKIGFNNNNRDRINYSVKNSDTFNYKTSITEQSENDDEEKEDIKTVMPLKYFSNFWRTPDIPLINCEVSLDLTWSKNCALTSKATRNALAAEGDNPSVAQINNPRNADFEITECKLYAPVVTLSAENDNKLLEQLKTVFKMSVTWTNSK